MVDKNVPCLIYKVFELGEVDNSRLTTVQEDAIFHMSELLNLHETHAIASNLRNNSDIVLMLDFVLDVCIVLLILIIQCFTFFSYSSMAV